MNTIHRKLPHWLLACTAVVCAISISSCGDDEIIAAIDPATIEFDEQRAFEQLKYLCNEIGPRRIGTAGSVKTQKWIEAEIAELSGWTYSVDEFTAKPPQGARRRGDIKGANVFARREGTQPGEIWICSHYDTFDKPGFVGANDGGSSTVVLLELARQLQGDSPLPGMSIVMCWFDGEESFPPVRWNDNTNSTFGSRYVAHSKRDDNTLSEIKAFILLDMVGDKNLGLVKDTTSHSGLKRIFEQTAQQLGD
ncbi:MAG: M28 family peptidase, partial [Planctomycetota bacterium]|nr:M28 family peptidase [Planctomycetota bacterium]